MSALAAPASVVVPAPMPFLLQNQYDTVGDLVVVRDEDWDKLVELVKTKYGEKSYIIVDTDRGPFMIIKSKITTQ